MRPIRRSPDNLRESRAHAQAIELTRKHSMKAILMRAPGETDVLQSADVPIPEIAG